MLSVSGQFIFIIMHAQSLTSGRGAAYGIAGLVKGCGLSSLRRFNIMSSIRDSIEDKKNANARQGAMFAIETLFTTLGRIFEPYVIKVLPSLLSLMGDSSLDVREATQDASRTIMSRVSGHAVKLILPSLLGGLDDRRESKPT